ncbi:CBS domain-containing protein [Tepidibacter hydrothermalis]|uniref:CBS domain-containing protein n=1 Tax=Tepidibacter hydrothermalis TaxID=3036126 RepID=A0ABY8ECI3_9FIRM|nr:CBS domain-containing protein [Tepidibacter hydrothermalis]WFD10631.1 CBS domain-containing protein [Tepidibacter hydrothermalis]
MTAKDIMTSNVVVVNQDATIKEIAEIFLKNRIGGVPVVDEENKIVGIISETDIIQKEKNVNIPSFINILQGYIFFDSFKEVEEDIRKIAAYKARDIMSKDVMTVKEDDSVEYVANEMIKKSINRVPVVDDNNYIKGIICRYDLIKAMYK